MGYFALKWSNVVRNRWPANRAGARFSNVPKTFRARKAICEIANRLFWKADLLTCFKVTKREITVKFDELNALRS